MLAEENGKQCSEQCKAYPEIGPDGFGMCTIEEVSDEDSGANHEITKRKDKEDEGT